jgi:hypothetical protein
MGNGATEEASSDRPKDISESRQGNAESAGPQSTSSVPGSRCFSRSGLQLDKSLEEAKTRETGCSGCQRQLR